jgi:peptide/nickel transport system substrate-binding protein
VAAIVAGSCGGDTDEPRTDTTRAATSAVVTETTEATTTSEVTTTTEPAPSFSYGGSVVIGDDQEPPTLNPFAPGGDNFIVSIVGQAHLAGAYDIDGETLDLVPELVTELPSVGNGGVVINDDGTMTVRYQVRDEAVWSDGVPITGDDFQFTLDTILDPTVASFDKTDYENVVATNVDGKTFELTLAAPSATYEMMFPTVLPRHAVEGSDLLADWNDVMWPAAGPFVFDEWKRGEYVRLVRNENYWKVDPEMGVQLPWLDSVEFRFIPETESIVYAFTQRELDVIQPPPAPEIIDRLRELESAGADVQVEAGPVWEHLNFQFGPNNRNPDSLNEYLAFRQAIGYAIDADVLAPLVGWQPITSMLNPAGEEGPWAQYAQDLTKAKELVALACEQAGRSCEAQPPVLIFSTTSNAEARPRIADNLKMILGAIGVEVELQLEDSQLFFGETLDNGTWDVGWWAWVAQPGASGFVSMLDLFDPNAPLPDGANYYRWGTADSSVQDEAVERFVDVLEIARQTVDPEELRTLARAAEQILADNAVIVPVGARTVVGAVWADTIYGFEMNPTQASHAWNIESWRRIDL